MDLWPSVKEQKFLSCLRKLFQNKQNDYAQITNLHITEFIKKCRGHIMFLKENAYLRKTFNMNRRIFCRQ